METSVQLVFPATMSWPLQCVPVTSKRLKHLKSTIAFSDCYKPVYPDPRFMQMLLKVGKKRLAPGHSRQKIDTPKKADSNQLQWCLSRQFGYQKYSEAGRTRLIIALLEYGFLEQRQHRIHGTRYRLTIYGWWWLEKTVASK